ncbi:MAG: hypothetical protein IKK59_05550 [Lachnospiraceae bacterium]|nr:hypothetical protein [Lachnospiraceae bacterium]
MPGETLPKSVVRLNKDGVKFVSSVDRCSYTIKELSRAALRDVGRFVCKTFRKSFYQHFTMYRGRVGKYTQYWVKHKYEKHPVLQVGMKPNGFYGGFQELGTSREPKLGLLTSAVEDNIATIIKIESQYLSALEDEAKALSLISNDDYEGNGD